METKIASTIVRPMKNSNPRPTSPRSTRVRSRPRTKARWKKGPARVAADAVADADLVIVGRQAAGLARSEARGPAPYHRGRTPTNLMKIWTRTRAI
jgi:hypothetical protein